MRLLLTGALLLVVSAACAKEPEAVEKHWSLRPRTRPIVPRFDDAMRACIRTPVDAFILERLVKDGLRPPPEADRAILIRRLTFDLTGLPPTPAEVAAFTADSSPDAYEKLVDRLLSSPRYGERWGRHWLDVVRFAESEGYEYDRHVPGAWRFRDYVIDAVNADKPYDRFILEQLAGDEIDPDNPELLIAAGFHRLGPVRRNAGNQELAFSRHEVLTEMTDIVGSAFLGLTVGCARCHDHMFDDIPQEDYYRLQAFMAATHEQDVLLAPTREQEEWKARAEQMKEEIKRLKQSLPDLPDAERRKAIDRIRDLEESLIPPFPVISTVRNVEAERTPVHILKRGNTDRKDRPVGPRMLSALIPAGIPELPADTPKPRTALARRIASADNPLTARVMVNRIWQRHFGRGLVATANDFGVNGSPPTHPELLDWLANEFIAGGWSVKRMHRLIVTSSFYRQSSTPARSEEATWHGFPRRRLNAEEIRDAMLAISGRLNEKLGGQSILLPVDEDLVNLLYAPTQWAVTKDPAEHDRRSVYPISKRNLRLPFMEAFDQPDAQTSCATRESSTHALQALELLNGRIANDLAGSFAERLRREAGDDPTRQVDLAYRLVAGRPPLARERDRAVAFLKTQPLREFALAMFNLNAFLYVE